MSLAKAALGVVTLRFDQTLEQSSAFAAEVLTKAYTAPNTHGPALRALKTVDAAVHGTVTALQLTPLSIIPFESLLADSVAAVYGGAKIALGKTGELVVGKGGFASDLKASGRLSLSAAGLSFCGGATCNAIPIVGGPMAAGVSAALHAGATMRAVKDLRAAPGAA